MANNFPPAEPDGHLPNPSSGWIYLLLLFSLPVIYMVCAIVVVPSEWAHRHTRNTYEANLGYGEQLHNANCDVLIYGDSSAMVGVNPQVIKDATGLSACNIAEFEGITTVLGTGVVDTFLQQNPRPKVLIFIFGPDDLNPQKGWTGPSRMDAVIYTMRTRRNFAMVEMMLAHPADAFGALESGLRLVLRDDRKAPLSPQAANLRRDHDGWFPLPVISNNRCPLINPPAPVDRNWIQGLRNKYATNGTRVLFFVIPVPDCDAYAPQIAKSVEGISDNGLMEYPLELYSGEDAGVHLIGPGVNRFSTYVAQRVKQAVSPDSGGAPVQ